LTHCFSFFLTRPLTPHIYTLSLHDALPISVCQRWPGSHAYLFTGVTRGFDPGPGAGANAFIHGLAGDQFGKSVGIAGAADLHIRDRKSTRLNSSHVSISYAVFCLKKKIMYI